MKLSLGFQNDRDSADQQNDRSELLQYINLKLAANGLPVAKAAGGTELVKLAAGLITNFREKTRLLHNHRCPVDQRIESFLNRYFNDVLAGEGPKSEPLRVPGRGLVLDRHGLNRELSFPADGNEFKSEYLHSYRVRNGALHNPRSDRRTTVGTFHVCEGGLAIPGDKRTVSKKTYVELFRHAMTPPSDLLLLPFTANQDEAERARRDLDGVGFRYLLLKVEYARPSLNGPGGAGGGFAGSAGLSGGFVSGYGKALPQKFDARDRK